MTERALRARRAGPASLLALLTVLPACTVQMWADYEAARPAVELRLVGEASVLSEGALVAEAPIMTHGMSWSDAEGEPRWFLHPAAGAELAAELIEDREFCVVEHAEIVATRRYVVSEVISDHAQLELHVRVRDEALGEVVSPGEVSRGAARVLLTSRRNAFVFAADPGYSLPAILGRCAQRLRSVDLGMLVGTMSDLRAESWVFVGRDGWPSQVRADVRAILAEPRDGMPSLRDQLEVLRDYSLLVRVQHDGQPVILRLRPDRLLLLSGLDGARGRFVHRSGWRLERPHRHRAKRVGGDATQLACALHLDEQLFTSHEHAVFDGEFWGRVVLTPVTIALDLVFGPNLPRLWSWLTGKDPTVDDRPVRRR